MSGLQVVNARGLPIKQIRSHNCDWFARGPNRQHADYSSWHLAFGGMVLKLPSHHSEVGIAPACGICANQLACLNNRVQRLTAKALPKLTEEQP